MTWYEIVIALIGSGGVTGTVRDISLGTWTARPRNGT